MYIAIQKARKYVGNLKEIQLKKNKKTITALKCGIQTKNIKAKNLENLGKMGRQYINIYLLLNKA